MNRYINAGNLLTKIKAYRPYQYLGEDALSYAIKMVELEPSADVRENVRAKWVNNIHDIPICNQCGYMTPYDMLLDDYEYGNFCPNCGAEMERG